MRSAFAAMVILGLAAGAGLAAAQKIAFPRGINFDQLAKTTPASRFAVKATERDRDNHSRFTQSGKAICDGDPEASIDGKGIRALIESAHQGIASDSLRANRLLIVTDPVKTPANGQASYYVISVELNACTQLKTYRSCNFDARANRMTAPLRGNIVQVASATAENDALTRKLIKAAQASVIEATIWCRAKSAIEQKIQGVSYD